MFQLLAIKPHHQTSRYDLIFALVVLAVVAVVMILVRIFSKKD